MTRYSPSSLLAAYRQGYLVAWAWGCPRWECAWRGVKHAVNLRRELTLPELIARDISSQPVTLWEPKPPERQP